MKKLIVFIVSVLAVVIAADIFTGLVADRYMSSARLPGDYRSVDYVMRESRDSILILGSSVALNSLMPAVIEDSLPGMTCFNGAANAQQLPFFLAMLDCVLQRETPRMVVVGLETNACATTGTGERFNLLAPYYHRGYDYLDSCMEGGTTIGRIKLSSNLLRYNTIWWRILLYHFVTADNPGEKGFVAKDIPPLPPTLASLDEDEPMSDERRQELERLVGTCSQHGIKLIVFFPPQYQHLTGSNKCRDQVKSLLSQHGLTCLDYSQDSTFLNHPEWFYDNIHLNGDGARVFTARFVNDLLHNNQSE